MEGKEDDISWLRPATVRLVWYRTNDIFNFNEAGLNFWGLSGWNERRSTMRHANKSTPMLLPILKSMSMPVPMPMQMPLPLPNAPAQCVTANASQSMRHGLSLIPRPFVRRWSEICSCHPSRQSSFPVTQAFPSRTSPASRRTMPSSPAAGATAEDIIPTVLDRSNGFVHGKQGPRVALRPQLLLL